MFFAHVGPLTFQQSLKVGIALRREGKCVLSDGQLRSLCKLITHDTLT